VPVCCGGVIVNPGDLIVADEIGVAVVPYGRLAEVYPVAREQADKEIATRKEILKGAGVDELLEKFGFFWGYSMKTLKKILATTMIAAMVLGLAGCGGNTDTGGTNTSDDGVVTLKIAHGASETYHMHRAIERFKELVEETGQFQVEIYPAQQFGSDGEMIEGVKTGDLTMAVSPSSYMTEELPSMSLIELPYVYPNRETAWAVLNGEWGQKELDELEEAGLHGLGYMENGMRQLTNNKKEIHHPEDLNGMKLRTMQVQAHVDFWNSLGCSAEGSPFSELYTNLSTGVFDGEENPIAHIFSQKFYEVQKYITISDHVFTAYVPVMTVDFWDSLSEEKQTIINDAFKEAYNYQMELVEKEEPEELEEMEAAGCVVNRLTDEEKQEFIEAAQPTLQKYREIVGDDVYDEFTAAIEAAQK